MIGPPLSVRSAGYRILVSGARRGARVLSGIRWYVKSDTVKPERAIGPAETGPEGVGFWPEPMHPARASVAASAMRSFIVRTSARRRATFFSVRYKTGLGGAMQADERNRN